MELEVALDASVVDSELVDALPLTSGTLADGANIDFKDRWSLSHFSLFFGGMMTTDGGCQGKQTARRPEIQQELLALAEF